MLPFGQKKKQQRKPVITGRRQQDSVSPLCLYAQGRIRKIAADAADGVQRLTAINSFMKNEFKLKNLEYLKECNGKWFI